MKLKAFGLFAVAAAMGWRPLAPTAAVDTRMRLALIAASAAVLAMPVAVSAHSGGTNADGCHNNRKTGDYHCHGGGRRSSAPARPQGLIGGAPSKRGGGAYANCAEARAAGAAPIRRGQPGYGAHLDRDGDGVGCERG